MRHKENFKGDTRKVKARKKKLPYLSISIQNCSRTGNVVEKNDPKRGEKKVPETSKKRCREGVLIWGK